MSETLSSSDSATRDRAAAFIADHRFDEADDVLPQGIAGGPGDPSLLANDAAQALERGDFDLAGQWAALLRAYFPNHEEGFRFGIAVSLKLERFEAAAKFALAAQQRFPDARWTFTEKAKIAQARGDWAEADRCWASVRAGWPTDIDGWSQGAQSLRSGGKLAAAEELIVDAMRRFSYSVEPYTIWAEIAEDRQNWYEAEQRWSTAVAAFPDDPRIALRRALAPAAMPLHLRALRDWTRAFSLLRELESQFPDFAAGYCAHIRLLREAKELDQAEALGALARRRFPDEPDIASECARLMRERGQFDQAAAELAAAVEQLPGAVALRCELAATLSRSGRFDEAESVCRSAIEQFRSSVGTYVEYARTAERRHDCEAALARWLDAERQFPGDLMVRRGVAMARAALAERGEAATADLFADALSTHPSWRSATELMLRFESLGGPGYGCEFGLVQRVLGAEPLGLLRWASTSIELLTEALECRFEGVGTPEQTVLKMWRRNNGSEEYGTADRRFGLAMHTFVSPEDVPWERMYEQSCRHIAFLRAKLLRELASARKIFVYRPEGGPSPAAIEKLHTAIGRYGDNTLLLLRFENKQQPRGAVEIVGPRLLAGYRPYTRPDCIDSDRRPELASWVAMCAEAARLCSLTANEHGDVRNYSATR